MGVYGVAPFRFAPSDRGGPTFGYSSLPEHALAEGVALLARAIADVRTS